MGGAAAERIFAPLVLIGLEKGLGQTDRALASARQALAGGAGAGTAAGKRPRRLFAAAALAALGDREGAMRFAARALALEPNDHPVQYNVACTYPGSGEGERALDVLEHTMPGAPPIAGRGSP